MSRHEDKPLCYYKILVFANNTGVWPGNEQAGRLIGSVPTKTDSVPLSGVQLGSYMSDMFDAGVIGEGFETNLRWLTDPAPIEREP